MKVEPIGRKDLESLYKYRVRCTRWGRPGQLAGFFELRNWCWDQFGPSVECDFIRMSRGMTNDPSNAQWSWDLAKNEIYLATDAERMMYELRWCPTETLPIGQ